MAQNIFERQRLTHSYGYIAPGLSKGSQKCTQEKNEEKDCFNVAAKRGQKNQQEKRERKKSAVLYNRWEEKEKIAVR